LKSGFKGGCLLLVAGCWLVSAQLGFGLQQGSQNVTQTGANDQKKATPAGADTPQSVTTTDTNAGQEPQAPHGTVLFEKSVPPVQDTKPEDEGPKLQERKAAEGVATAAAAVNSDVKVEVSDAERTALTFVAYDLDAHLVPARSEMVMRAKFSVRNDGAEPLARVVVQVSSALTWESFALDGEKLTFVQHLLDTDADHTGQAREAVVTLPQPLAVGATVSLVAFYSGEIKLSSGRLERIGAPVTQATTADWDVISAEGTWLRGFGSVLWYPVASPAVFLGDGAKLFQAVGQTKLRQSEATIRLRLTVEYVGETPKLAYFCGRMEPMVAVSENEDVAAASAPGIASVEFPLRALGFRVPSLFVTNDALKMADGVGSIAVVTEHDDALARFGATAGQIQPLMTEWIGESPLGPLNILDHEGQPFEDGALLVAPMTAMDTAAVATGLVHSLTHAWFSSSHVWLNEGMAQFMSYLWVERTQGRDAAIAQMQEAAVALALVEPAAGKGGGQSLIAASDEVYYRTKAAAVLWMLRSIAGEDALKQALHTYVREGKKDGDAKEFQRVLEQTSHKDLGWFFEDWVYRDRGLPDLSIANVSPRELEAKDGRGGWLVAVEVHNAGDAAVEVPVTVRSGTLTATERIRVLGGASSSTRILFEGEPTEVVLNDGSVPEVGQSLHVVKLKAPKS
jgi:Peptidase family M1 domain